MKKGKHFMVTANVKVINPQGLHMRPAHVFVSAIKDFPCSITIEADGKSINAKSIMQLMIACIKQNTEIVIRCDGEQEEEALQAAVTAIESGLEDL